MSILTKQNQSVKNYYDVRAGLYDQTMDENPKYLLQEILTERLMDTYLPEKGSRILDLGGGTGRQTLKLAQKGYQVDLVDISTEMLKVAEEKIRKSGFTKTVRIINKSVEDFYRDESFFYDFMLLNSSPSYFEEFGAILKNLVSRLSPGGYLLVSVENRIYRALKLLEETSLSDALERTINTLNTGYVPHNNDGFINNQANASLQTRAYYPEELQIIFQEAGLDTIIIKGSPLGTSLCPKLVWTKKTYKKEILEKMVRLEMELQKRDELRLYGRNLNIVGKRIGAEIKVQERKPE